MPSLPGLLHSSPGPGGLCGGVKGEYNLDLHPSSMMNYGEEQEQAELQFTTSAGP